MDRHRIDQWLKHVCLFKSRSEATEACKGGHVKVNGQRVKPAGVVREGDTVEFLHGTHYRRVVVVGVPERQASKEIARTLYVDETPKQEIDVMRTGARERGSGRPTKKDRRDMEKVRR